jgi:uncharacterized protein
MSTAVVIMALLMGFTGSLHCAGMCGPIMLVMPFQRFSGAGKVASVMLYHFGRLTSYALLAIVLHSFRGLFHPHVQQFISVALGVILLVVGLLSFFYSGWTVRLPWGGFIQRRLSQVIASPGLASLTVAGMLNGLLPCGLVYMALSASIAQSTLAGAAAVMYFFGLGTMPMLVGITLLKNRARLATAKHFKRLAPVMVFVFGCLFVLRGLDLGIPYLSPRLQVTQHGVHACCCHKQ